MTSPWLPVFGSIVVAVIGAWATWRTVRVGRMTNDRQAAIDGWQQWRTDAQALRTERDALAARIDQIKADCDDRANQLAKELGEVERRLEGCVEWIRAVMPALNAQGIPFPPVPSGITDTDPRLRRPDANAPDRRR
jgi:hypothetical protein